MIESEKQRKTDMINYIIEEATEKCVQKKIVSHQSKPLNHAQRGNLQLTNSESHKYGEDSLFQSEALYTLPR